MADPSSSFSSQNPDDRRSLVLRALALVGLCLVVVGWVLVFVDLAPRVGSDFFFATDDPQLASAAAIEELFPSSPQVVLAASAQEVRSPTYTDAVRRLGREIAAVDGVAAVRSLARGPSSPAAAFESPFWRRLLVAPDESATQLIVELAPPPEGAVGKGEDGEGEDGEDSGDAATAGEPGLDPEAASAARIAALEEVVERVSAEVAASGEVPGFSVALSGVPYVVESIRRHLLRDLLRFTLIALVVFGLAVSLLYRDPWIALGALLASVTAAAGTLGLLSLLGVSIGLLTANLATIVFVLTLSHTIYLTSNHRRLAADGGLEGKPLLRAAVRRTWTPSLWCAATTLLGFLSLLLAAARPMRELGVAGAVGTAVALAVAYGVYPSFLALSSQAFLSSQATRRSDGDFRGARDPFGGRRLGPAVAVAGLVVLGLGLGLTRLETDPELLSYFPPGSELREGLAAIDAAGGSSPLSVVYRDASGETLASLDAFTRLEAVQGELDADPAVGTALGLPALVGEARRSPMGALLPPPNLLAILGTPAFDSVASAFVTPDHRRGLFFLRMREAGRNDERREVIGRVEEAFRRHGFEPVQVGGLYDLQGRLARLVSRSLATGLAGLGVLLVLVGWAVSRSPRVTAVMLVCLAGTPLALLGALGWLGMPFDVIASPAANVAVATGVDAMIHLVTAMRRRRSEGLGPWEAWVAARAEQWRPIVGAAATLTAGFGLFLLSSFPPTQRFGLGVVVGLVVATVLTLVVLPALSAPKSSDEGSTP